MELLQGVWLRDIGAQADRLLDAASKLHDCSAWLGSEGECLACQLRDTSLRTAAYPERRLREQAYLLASGGYLGAQAEAYCYAKDTLRRRS